jgi:hypothetical protein
MTDSHPLERADDIYGRYVQWLQDTPEALRFPRDESGRPLPAEVALPDSVAHDAIDAMYELGHLDPRHAHLLTVFREVDREWTKGIRCPVCANADDPDFDHYREC